MQFNFLRLSLVIIALSIVPSMSLAQDSKHKANEEMQTVLFVCEHGAAKSVIAASYFDKLAEERGLKYRARFRGTHPDPVLNPVAEKGLKADGMNIQGLKPEMISNTDLTVATRIVTLGCALPGKDSVAGKVEEWNDVPSPSQNYEIARDDIVKRVRALVDDLEKTQSAAKGKKKP